MPARSTITLADGQGTPVNHAFTPRGETATGGHMFRTVAELPWMEKSVTVYGAKTTTGRRKPRCVVVVPHYVTEVVNGVNRPLYIGSVRMSGSEISIDADVPVSVVADCIAFMKNALGHADIKEVLYGNTNFW